jgi:hypothetical protein
LEDPSQQIEICQPPFEPNQDNTRLRRLGEKTGAAGKRERRVLAGCEIQYIDTACLGVGPMLDGNPPSQDTASRMIPLRRFVC